MSSSTEELNNHQAMEKFFSDTLNTVISWVRSYFHRDHTRYVELITKLMLNIVDPSLNDINASPSDEEYVQDMIEEGDPTEDEIHYMRVNREIERFLAMCVPECECDKYCECEVIESREPIIAAAQTHYFIEKFQYQIASHITNRIIRESLYTTQDQVRNFMRLVVELLSNHVFSHDEFLMDGSGIINNLGENYDSNLINDCRDHFVNYYNWTMYYPDLDKMTALRKRCHVIDRVVDVCVVIIRNDLILGESDASVFQRYFAGIFRNIQLNDLIVPTDIFVLSASFGGHLAHIAAKLKELRAKSAN